MKIIYSMRKKNFTIYDVNNFAGVHFSKNLYLVVNSLDHDCLICIILKFIFLMRLFEERIISYLFVTDLC